MPLDQYRTKRDFSHTPEPSGEAGEGGDRAALSFVVQKHDASRLHYDFRLEMEGVLRSWAVPKGPSLHPGEKRLAVHVEDHPLAYGDFEGVIPQGQYGGGTVLLWDRGAWAPEGDPVEGFHGGKLKFQLHGEKLRGGWTLVRMGGKAGEDGKNWLLIKERDEEALDEEAADVTVEHPTSVASGRDLEAIATARLPADPRPELATLEEEKPMEANTRTKRTGSSRRGDPDAGETAVLGVRLTSPGRILWPGQGVTKLALAHHYERVAKWILPHVARRPLSLVRCPRGTEAPCFFQKHPGDQVPDVVGRIVLPEKSGEAEYVYVDSAEGLVALVQIGTLEIHAWGSRIDRVERPDLMIFDLDPDPSVGWQKVVEGARELRERLAAAGLESWLKTTGGKGLHVVVPLTRRHDFDAVKSFSQALAQRMARDRPDRYVATLSKAKRKGKIFVDYLRNARGATAIVPYSSRARAGAPVAVPIGWEELDDGVRPDTFTVETLPRRLQALADDPWDGIDEVRQSLTKRAWSALEA